MDYRDHQAGVDVTHFWFRGKHGLINYLLSQATLHKQSLILNVGAGTGDDLVVIKKFGAVCVLDVDQHALDMIPLDMVIEKKCADVCGIPYPDQHFDVVVACDVMEHVVQDQKMVDEIYRVLKPGGAFIFTVPAFNYLYSGHDEQLGHVRRYNKKMIRPLMKHFRQQVLGYWFFLLFIPAAMHRLMNKKSAASSMFKLPSLINVVFYMLLWCENWCIAHGATFPFGLTLYGVYKK